MSLPPLSISPRATRVRAAFDAAGIDALLVTRLPNIRYLTGFTGSAAMVLVTTDGLTFTTDGRYAEQSGEQLGAAGVTADIEIGATQNDQRDALVAAAHRAGASRIGLEAHGVTWAQQRQMSGWFGSGEVVPTDHLVETLRLVKDPGEVARIRAACALGDAAFAEVVTRLAGRPTEREIALALEFAMRSRGASATSFDPIVAAGPNGAMPHARPSDRPIEAGELVVLDFGCVVDGYCSDMTRTVSVGAPAADQQRLVDVVREAQARGCAAVRAGAQAADVDAACREVIEAAGLGEYFVHSTGHGVGLEIHEAPRVAKTASDTLEAGFVVTVEPGVYVPGVGGVRVEDTVVVTDDGAEPLTLAPKELVVA